MSSLQLGKDFLEIIANNACECSTKCALVTHCEAWYWWSYNFECQLVDSQPNEQDRIDRPGGHYMGLHGKNSNTAQLLATAQGKDTCVVQ